MQTFPFSTFFESAEDYPSPSGPSLGLEELAPADVLLSRGEGDLANCIVAADGGSYSHAALWTGTTVLEARLDGVRERKLVGERDVYRFCKAGRQLTEQDAQKVLDQARSKIGGSYATHELFLLGSLFALGLFPRRSLLRFALDLLGPVRAERLEQLLTELDPRCAPVICTELVALAFYHADRSRSLALHILPIADRPSSTSSAKLSAGTPPPTPLDGAGALQATAGLAAARAWQPLPDADVNLIGNLRQHCAQLRAAALKRSGPELRLGDGPLPAPSFAARGSLWGSLAVVEHSGESVGIITPADLQFSPSLRFVGRVSLPSARHPE